MFRVSPERVQVTLLELPTKLKVRLSASASLASGVRLMRVDPLSSPITIGVRLSVGAVLAVKLSVAVWLVPSVSLANQVILCLPEVVAVKLKVPLPITVWVWTEPLGKVTFALMVLRPRTAEMEAVHCVVNGG